MTRIDTAEPVMAMSLTGLQAGAELFNRFRVSILPKPVQQAVKVADFMCRNPIPVVLAGAGASLYHLATIQYDKEESVLTQCIRPLRPFAKVMGALFVAHVISQVAHSPAVILPDGGFIACSSL